MRLTEEAIEAEFQSLQTDGETDRGRLGESEQRVREQELNMDGKIDRGGKVKEREREVQ